MINPQSRAKVKKSIHFPVMESFDLNLMATDDPSNCGSIQQGNYPGSIGFNTHGGPTNDPNKLLNQAQFAGTFNKYSYNYNTTNQSKDTLEADPYDTLKSAERANNFSNSQYNVRPVSFLVMDHERPQQAQENVIAGEDPDKMNEEEGIHAREPEMTNTEVFFTKPVDESSASNMFKKVSVDLKKSEYGQTVKDPQLETLN